MLAALDFKDFGSYLIFKFVTDKILTLAVDGVIGAVITETIGAKFYSRVSVRQSAFDAVLGVSFHVKYRS